MFKQPRSKKLYCILSLLVMSVLFLSGLFFTKMGYVRSTEQSFQNVELWANARSWKRGDVRGAKGITKLAREAEYDAVFSDIIKRNPDIEIEWEPVADEENGFSQWRELKERILKDVTDEDGDLTFKKELDAILSGETEWGSEDTVIFMGKYAVLLDEMTAIGLLKENSAAGVSLAERGGFQSITKSRRFVEFLLAGSRFAAESGDDELAITRLKAAEGISGHYYSVEASSFWDATLGILNRLETLSLGLEYVFPNVEQDQKALSELRRELDPPNLNDSLKVMLQGEFAIGMRSLIIPVVINDSINGGDGAVEDVEVFYDAVAQSYLTAIDQVADLSERGLLDLARELRESPVSNAPAHLSEKAQGLYSSLFMGFGDYYYGFIRSHAIYNQHDAAMAILANEEIPLEPITGQPYVFDEKSRTLSLPEDDLLEGFEIKPINLP